MRLVWLLPGPGLHSFGVYLLGPNGRAVSGAPLVMDYGWTAR